MEINLFSKCIKDLIVENDKVDVPYLGTFQAEMVPASYSDKQTTIHPPYRKMSFHKHEVSPEEGRLLLDKVRREIGVSQEQASVELGWCLSRLSSELEGRKICKLPGLGVMRANAHNEFFFVPDDDLDIWPDGLGLEEISIKVNEIPGQAGNDEEGQAGHDEESLAGNDEAEAAGGISEREHFFTERDEIPEQPEPEVKPEPEPEPEPVPAAAGTTPSGEPEKPVHGRRSRPLLIVLLVLTALVVLFIIASYLFTDEMSPILDRLLYTKEELELLRR